MNLFQNYWHVICTSKEVKLNQPHAFRIFGIQLVIWKNQTNQFFCIEDKCPHRGYPLSEGKVNLQSNIVCPYHGWEFNGQGKCVTVPSEGCKSTKLRICVQHFDIQESEGLIWIRRSQIASTSSTKQQYYPLRLKQDRKRGYSFIVKKKEFDASLVEVIENFMDSAHTGFVHKNLIRSSQSSITRTVKIEQQENSISVLHEPVHEKVGLFSKILNPYNDPVIHSDTVHLPGAIHVQYAYGQNDIFKSYIYCVPRSKNKTTVYIYVGLKTKHKYIVVSCLLKLILKCFLPVLAKVILKQDYEILTTLNQQKQLNIQNKDIFLESDTALKHVTQMIEMYLRGETSHEFRSQSFQMHI